MKTVMLKSIVLKNFKGIKDFELDNLGKEISIRGKNGTGKSTIMDAFFFLLFGKDSHGRTDFEINPLTLSGEPVHNLDSIVSAVFVVDGQEISLKKTYREKWEKRRGKAEVVFNGHETEYQYNLVPVTMREYNTKIETICPENLFRLLTNPLYFPNLPWQEQRRILFDIAGTIPDEEIASQNKVWLELLKVINANKTLDEYKREIASEKRKIKDDLDRIPARIDEVQRSIPQEEDWKTIEKSIMDKSAEIKTIDQKISDISAGMEKEFAGYSAKQSEINKRKSALQAIEFDVQKELNQKFLTLLNKNNEYNSNLINMKAEKDRSRRSILNLTQERQGYENDKALLLKEYQELNKPIEFQISEAELRCPTCQRMFSLENIAEKKEQIIAQMNIEKAVKISKNIYAGKEMKTRIEMISEQITELTQKNDQIGNEIFGLEAIIEEGEKAISEADKNAMDWQKACETNVNYQSILHEIQMLEELIGTEPKRVNITDQTNRKDVIHVELKDLIQRLNNREFINRAKRRIIELSDEQKSLAQKLADLEKIEYTIQGFTKAKIEAIEDKVNSMFSIVEWRMYKKQVNGEQQEVCESMINGIPYSDANNGGKIQAGYDIINVLSDYYGVCAPCFSDNAEAISEFPKINSQSIRLYVTDDKNLVVN